MNEALRFSFSAVSFPFPFPWNVQVLLGYNRPVLL